MTKLLFLIDYKKKKKKFKTGNDAFAAKKEEFAYLIDLSSVTIAKPLNIHVSLLSD